jgi:hypothetical protein
VDVLFSSLGSKVAVDTVAVLLKVEPGGVAGGMFATNVKFAIDPDGKFAIVQVIVPFVPTEGFEQLNAGPLFWVSETKVIPAGSGSVSDTVAAASGPLFITWMEKETSEPGAAVPGAVLVTERSARLLTVAVLVCELFALFESAEVVVTVAVFANVVPPVALPGTLPTIVKFVVAPTASVAMLHETVPFEPAGGVLHANTGPDCARDVKVIPGGRGSVI